jgi:hypothetical protein
MAGSALGQSPGSAPAPVTAPGQAAAATTAARAIRTVADPVPVVERDDQGAVSAVRATRIAEPIVLDGRLEEDVYERVPFIDGFVQQEPAQGQPGTEKTVVWLLYDERNIYVSGRLYDSQPEREIITEMRRDGQGTNDNESFGVVFDTFHDRRNGFLFQISLAGGLFDGYITDERDMSRDWSTVWNARTARTPDGWTVEMAIPFKSLRYPPGGSQTWGINLKRVVRWKNETQHLTEIPAVLGRRGMNRLSAGATLVGLEAPNIHRVFEVKPYGVSGFTTEAPAGSLTNTSGKGDGGFDVKVGITKGLTADVTYNTDFAQVELDEQHLTRFSIQFPEKREFFLEGQGIFSFGGVAPGPRGGGGGGFGNPQANDVPVMFFSRTIGLDNGRPTPIDVGARMTGKAGKYSIGLIDIRSAGVEGRGIQATNFGVVRVKRDILRRSAIGMIYTDRSNSSLGLGAGRTAGVDGIFSFGQNLSFNSYFAVTDNPGLSGRNTSHRVQMDYNADKYGVQVERVALGENFRPDVGFTRRTAFTRNSAYLRYSPRPNRKLLRKWYVDAGYDHITDPQGRLQSSQAQAAFRSEFQNGDSWAIEIGDLYEYLPTPFTIAKGVTLPVGGYSFAEVRFAYNFGPQRPVSANVQFERGQFYGGERTTLSASRGRLQISPQLMMEPGVTLNAVTTPYGDFTSTLISNRATYTMTPRQGVSALLQYNSANNSLSTNIRYRWEYIPGSDLFVVLTDNRDTLPRGFPQLRDRSLIVKFTKLFRF